MVDNDFLVQPLDKFLSNRAYHRHATSSMEAAAEIYAASITSSSHLDNEDAQGRARAMVQDFFEFMGGEQ